MDLVLTALKFVGVLTVIAALSVCLLLVRLAVQAWMCRHGWHGQDLSWPKAQLQPTPLASGPRIVHPVTIRYDCHRCLREVESPIQLWDLDQPRRLR